MTGTKQNEETIYEKIRIVLESKHLHSEFAKEIKKILLKHFQQDTKKKYYVIKLISFNIDRHFTNNSNSECVVIVNAQLYVFYPKIGSILTMTIADVDIRNKFSIAHYCVPDGFFKVSIDGIHNLKENVLVQIENLKNYKNQIIGIGKIISNPF
jgi:hypothetical protein